MNEHRPRARYRLTITGIIQGVGFRPYVYRLATDCTLDGSVRNTPAGVCVEIEGPTEQIEQFCSRLPAELPPLACITHITREACAVTGEHGFQIGASSHDGQRDMAIPPDIAMCDRCLAEMRDPRNRRYGYAFTNCTDCGPRLTIVRDIPYDRSRTAMACFPLCPQCRAEYSDPTNRRFHAEPNACPVCGPQLRLLDADGQPQLTANPLAATIRHLQNGCIVAIKALGGFHLCVDAANDTAVQRLRDRKQREAKPFAIMVRDVVRAQQLARINGAEARLLTRSERPIVLLDRTDTGQLAAGLAPGMAWLGIMLPCTPLQHLLLRHPFTALVMTSANRSDEPICIGNREAVQRLYGVADFFLVHNRDIVVRCDDSIMCHLHHAPRTLRRARGFVPQPLALGRQLPDVLAVGAQLKNTQCIIHGAYAHLSPHVGDLETPEARDFFDESVRLLQRLTICRPGIVACDLHPDYYATRQAHRLDADQVIAVQHHHAHIAACMAEHQLRGTVVGLAMDGTGYGPDGTIWGGEVLVADETGFERAGHLQPLALPGGEAAIRQPWRIAAALLQAADIPDWRTQAQALLGPAPHLEPVLGMVAQNINCVAATSLGRLFDGVAALIGLRHTVSFEGQAAMELESIAGSGSSCPELPVSLQTRAGTIVIDYRPMIIELVRQIAGGPPQPCLAAAFHACAARSLAAAAAQISSTRDVPRVLLSGGCFQNRLLLASCIERLEAANCHTYAHRAVPTGDGGIALGQAYVAACQAAR